MMQARGEKKVCGKYTEMRNLKNCDSKVNAFVMKFSWSLQFSDNDAVLHGKFK